VFANDAAQRLRLTTNQHYTDSRQSRHESLSFERLSSAARLLFDEGRVIFATDHAFEKHGGGQRFA
jgi:hypothetical protein